MSVNKYKYMRIFCFIPFDFDHYTYTLYSYIILNLGLIEGLKSLKSFNLNFKFKIVCIITKEKNGHQCFNIISINMLCYIIDIKVLVQKNYFTYIFIFEFF